jgi:hypothetical protein
MELLREYHMPGFTPDTEFSLSISNTEETSAFKTLTVKDVVKVLNVSKNYVYRNKHALGAFQACRGGRLLFSEENLKRIIGDNTDAIPGKKWEMESPQNDRWKKTNEIIQKQKPSKKMGGGTKHNIICKTEDRYGLLDNI